MIGRTTDLHGPVISLHVGPVVHIVAVLGNFGHGHFGLGRFGLDISATDISATENTKGGRFGHNHKFWVCDVYA